MNGASLTAIMFGEVQLKRLSCFDLKEDEPIKEYMKRFKPIGGDPKKRHLYYDDNNNK
jgi:hypothetical protein